MSTKKMDVLSWNPIAIAVLAGVLGVGAAALTVLSNYITQSRQSGNTAAIRQELKDQTDLLRGLVAQAGDNKAIQDAIESRTKVLETGRAPEADEIQQILADVPRLAEDYKKLQQTKASAEEKRLAEFRLKWEPAIQSLVAEFDRRVDTVLKSGIKAELKKEPFKVAGIGQDGGNGQLVRVAVVNGVELRLYVSSAQIHVDRIHDARLDITVRIPQKQENESNPLGVTFSLDEAAVIGGKTFPASLSSAEDKPLLEAMFPGVNKGIETWLVIANARK